MDRNRSNELLVAGFVGGILQCDHRVEVLFVDTDNNEPYPGIDIRIPDTVKSQYRITVERIEGSER